MRDPTLEQIIAARNRCAQIITLYGERYLPIFERLEKEIALRQQQQILLKKALEIGSQNGTQNGPQIGTQTACKKSEFKKKFNNISNLARR